MPVTVAVDPSAVVVELSGWDAVWSFRRRLVVAQADVAGARVVPRSALAEHLGLRWGGTHVPGVITAGRYGVRGRRGERAFCLARRGGELLLVETSRPRPRYVILEVSDPAGLAARIEAAAGR